MFSGNRVMIIELNRAYVFASQDYISISLYQNMINTPTYGINL